MNLAQYTANPNTFLGAPSLSSAVAKTVDNFRILTPMSIDQPITKIHERRRWTVSGIMGRIMDRLTWYHFLTPSDAVDPVPDRGRVASTTKESRPSEGRWDILIP